ncbi:retrovirus-related Pol polyprotein from transposon 17.6 [Nephila pilipes]|uniref:Retrovirus-related Pol polyprotein from transposon 17.6 n=1 Tax=Nephila pilipes TaxID=299642 RepID=A0A8X6UI96_NEPPI|nr:retrovirus-related Pol polyprotein from transposon 17.6 [Nephila pilipes]
MTDTKCKSDLAKAALLSFPKSGLPLSLCADASDFAIGSVLQQYVDESWKSIAFYSKKLNETQKAYSTYDRELLGIYLSVKHFKHLLEGNDFIIYTDHKPLTFAFQQKNDKASPRQQRQLQYISEFSTNI